MMLFGIHRDTSFRLWADVEQWSGSRTVHSSHKDFHSLQ